VKLLRVYAFTVVPQRKAATPSSPSGGSLRVNAGIQQALDEAYKKAKLDRQDVIDFRVDPATRTCEVRDSILELAFGDARKAKSIALTIATRLSKSMDDRSPSALLVLSTEEDGAKARRATFWAFPRDESFQFRNNKSGVVVKLLQDTFSRNSRLRKAAMFEGHRTKADFLSGRVLDYQADTGRKAADYWIDLFLDCTLGLKGEAGTRILAQCLRKAFADADDSATRENLYAAMMAIRHSNQRRTSLKKFARERLNPKATKLFLDASPNDEIKTATFDFKKDVFDRTLNFRVFQLEKDIYVSAPLGTIGKEVTVTDGPQRRLKCEGIVKDEKLKARHG
jgi:hypothetical protein